MNSRRRFLSAIVPAGLVLQSKAAAQAPQVNASTQIKNLPPSSTGDNWRAQVPTGTINGTNTAFGFVAGGQGKLRVFLNGIRMHQGSELPTGTSPNIIVSGTTITFAGPVPAVGDAVLVETA
jgi:hypothetical protein